MEIIYTNEEVMGEPGPNLLFKGKPEDFLKIVNYIHILGVNNDVEISLKGTFVEKITGVDDVIFRSKKYGNVLSKKIGNFVISELDSRLWKGLIKLFLDVSFSSSSQYVEFEDNIVSVYEQSKYHNIHIEENINILLIS